MKILGSKKATEVIADWGPWMFFIVAVGVLAIFIVKIANVNVAEASKIPKDLEDELILVTRFYNSQNCFAYEDDVGRVYTRVIDIDKFNQENMENCFQESEVNYAFSLTLTAPRPRTSGPGPPLVLGPVNTFNWYGGYAEKVITEDVLVISDGKRYSGKLRIKIQNVR